MAYSDSIRTASYVSREQIADLIEGIFSSSYENVWQSWTPTWGASGSMTYTGVTIERAIFAQVGTLVFFTVGAIGTIGGSVNTGITFTLPVVSDTAASTFTIGAGYVDDAASTAVASYCFLNSTSAATIRFFDNRNFALGVGRATATGFYRAA